MMFVRSQKGMSVLGWMAVLALVAFFSSAVFKMFPHYMDYMSLENMVEEAGLKSSDEIGSVESFYTYIGRGMEVNNIRDMSPREVMTVSYERNEFKVHLKYEKREPLIQNLDLVANFDKEFRIRAQ